MKPADQLSQRIADGEVILIDGGTGTELEARGARMDDNAWCALASVEHPDLLQTIHEDYIRAGAEVIITNTFSAGRPALEAAGHGIRWQEINRAAVRAAFRARDAADRPVIVAGSVGGLPTADDITFHERGLSAEQLEAAFADQSRILAEEGVDLIALEMIGPGTYAGPAVAGARAAGLPIWLGVSVLHLKADGETDYGTLELTEDRLALDDLIGALATAEIAAVTVMHSNLDQVSPALDLIRSRWDGPLGAYPHHGKFNAPHWEYHHIPPDRYAAEALEWIRHGANLVGGCCGIGPAHIAAVRHALDSRIVR